MRRLAPFALTLGLCLATAQGETLRSSDQDVAKAETATAAGQCVQCHLGGYEGNSRVPRLAGQKVSYLERKSEGGVFSGP